MAVQKAYWHPYEGYPALPTLQGTSTRQNMSKMVLVEQKTWRLMDAQGSPMNTLEEDYPNELIPFKEVEVLVA